MKTRLSLLCCCCLLAQGCTVVSANRVFPKLDWYWSRDAKMQRESRQQGRVTPIEETPFMTAYDK